MNFIPADDRHPFKYYYDENATGITVNGKQYKTNLKNGGRR